MATLILYLKEMLSIIVLKIENKKTTCKTYTQKEADQLFRDINIEQNGFHVLNWLAYLALRLGGWLAWRGHRKLNLKSL